MALGLVIMCTLLNLIMLKKRCSAQSKSQYKSGIVLCKVGIHTLLHDSGIVPGYQFILTPG